MTLADCLYFTDEKQLIEEVLLHMMIDKKDSRVRAITRCVRTILKVAREGNVKGRNKNVIMAYKGYREGLPTCFVDLVARDDLEKFRNIPAWDGVLVEWIPPEESLVEKKELQGLPFSDCIGLIAHGVDLQVMPAHMGEDAFPGILTAEICPSTDNYLTHSTPALIIGRLLKQAGCLYPDYGCDCDLLSGRWDIRTLGSRTESLFRLMHHPGFARDQMELRDELFNYISFYQALINCIEYERG